jgi:hypothetical protein
VATQEQLGAMEFGRYNPPTCKGKHVMGEKNMISIEKKEGKVTIHRCSDCNDSLCPVPCFRFHHSLEMQQAWE